MAARGRTLTTRHEASGAVKAIPGEVIKVTVESLGAGGGYVKLYDAAAATGTPIWQITVPDDTGWVVEFDVEGDFRTAIYAELSNAYIVVTFY